MCNCTELINAVLAGEFLWEEDLLPIPGKPTEHRVLIGRPNHRLGQGTNVRWLPESGLLTFWNTESPLGRSQMRAVQVDLEPHMAVTLHKAIISQLRKKS